MHRNTLRSRIAVSLFAYSVALAIAVLSVGYLVNEDVEKVIWSAILEPAMDRHLADEARLGKPSAAERIETYSVQRSEPWPDRVPAVLGELEPGFHDEIWIAGREVAVLVRDSDGWRDFVMVDITDLERSERSMLFLLLGGTAIATLLLVWTVRWLAGRLVRPVTQLAQSVDELDPTLGGLQLPIRSSATDEVAVIGAAINRLLDRINGFVNRERRFIQTVSHELRTPIAVIAGAAEVAAAESALPASVMKPLQRIRRATRDIDHLIATLLILAKSPERLLESATTFRLDELVREVVSDHMHLTSARSLELAIDTMQPTLLHTAERIAQIAISNLVRNAIEHSDMGIIRVSVSSDGVVAIQDPGHGMAADDISRVFTALARRGEDGTSRGIGLALISRICEHLDWTLDLQVQEQGTRAVLDLGGSLAAGNDTVTDWTPTDAA